LFQLQGIGEKRAMAILTFREKEMKFENVSDLSKVGFSQKQLDRFRHLNAASRVNNLK